MLLVFAAQGGCERGSDTTLASVKKQLEGQLGRVALGDFGGITFEPFRGTDWFLVVPAGAQADNFESPAFRNAFPQVPAELLSKPTAFMALIDDGKVVAVEELPPAYGTAKVFVKPGKVTHSLRFVRKAGLLGSYQIQGID